MAEFLLRAKPHWKDTWDSAKLATLSQQELRQYNARTQIGDIVVVRPDGWVWGNEECLPNFLVVKVPGIVLPHNYEESLMAQDGVDEQGHSIMVMLKHRKFQVPIAWMNSKIADGVSVITITLSAQKTALINSIIEKMS